MKSRYKILIVIATTFSILFIPPNVAAFTCNTLQIKDIQCHVMGMSFFGVQFKTNVYEWFGWTDSYPCGGVLAHPEKGYNCMGIEDYWGLPPQFSPSAERERYEPESEPVRTPPPEPPFEKEEPFTKIEIMFGEQLNDKLVPVTITEVTTHAETLDEITVWNFELIGHSGDDRRIVWDTLPKDKRILYEITNDDGLDIRIPENIISIPWDIHAYKMDCGFFQTVEGESAHPTLLQIKSNTSTIYAQNSRIGIYPDSNGEYSFEFASIFPNNVSFPEDAVEIISQETRECKLTQSIENDPTGKYIDGYYTKMTFRFN